MKYAADKLQSKQPESKALTKFRFIHNGDVPSTTPPQLIDIESGEDVMNKFAIESLTYEIQANDIPIVTARLYAFETDVQANVRWQMFNPIAGEYEEMAALEFRDGGRVEFDENGRPGYRVGHRNVVDEYYPEISVPNSDSE